MKFKHIIWDFDGTLFNTYPADSSAMKEALLHQGVDLDLQTVYDLMKISQGTLFDYVLAHFSIDTEQLSDDYTQLRFPAELRSLPYPGTKDLLRDIQSHGGSNYICTHRGESTFQILEAHGMRELFAGFVTRLDGFPPKPDPTGVLHLMKTYDFQANEAVMIGDRKLDIMAGRNAGLKGIGFWDGTGAKVDCADYQAESMEDIRSILGL